MLNKKYCGTEIHSFGMCVQCDLKKAVSKNELGTVGGGRGGRGGFRGRGGRGALLCILCIRTYITSRHL